MGFFPGILEVFVCFFFLLFIFLAMLCSLRCKFPDQGLKPGSSSERKVASPNHWTIREFLSRCVLKHLPEDNCPLPESMLIILFLFCGYLHCAQVIQFNVNEFKSNIIRNI